MFCYNCGKEIPENAMFCPFCGTQVNVKVADETPVAQEIETDAQADVQAEPVDSPVVETIQEETVNTYAEQAGEREIAPHTIGSFVFALVANELSVIPILGFIFSLVALIKSVKGRRIVAQNPEHYKLKGLLTVGFILSIIDLVSSIIAPIILATYFSIFKNIFDFSEISDVFTGFALF